ncbi:MAG: PIN domain-containing protein [Balneolaceae bacterium]
MDTNICLNLFLKDRPHASTSIQVMQLSEKKSMEGFVAGHAFDTIFYIIEKNEGTAIAQQAVSLCYQTVRVGTVNHHVIGQAVADGWKDFEDAVHHACAVQEQCDVIITHNQKNFSQSTIPVQSADEFISEHLQ